MTAQAAEKDDITPTQSSCNCGSGDSSGCGPDCGCGGTSEIDSTPAELRRVRTRHRDSFPRWCYHLSAGVRRTGGCSLTIPSTERGVEWDEDGLRAAVRTAGGYPYFIQAIGKHVWDNARSSPILPDDVEVGLADARREVDDGLYRSRWERATPVQRDVLRSLAAIGGDGPASVAAVGLTGQGRGGPSVSPRGGSGRRPPAQAGGPDERHQGARHRPSGGVGSGVAITRGNWG